MCLVGQRVQEFKNQASVIARLGEDEFVLIIKAGDYQVLSSFAQCVYDAVSLPYTLRNRSFQITCSIGISIWPKNGDEATPLLQVADMAMYSVKHSKSNRKSYKFYDAKMLALSQRKLELQEGLRDAISNNEMYVVLQPQFSVGDQCNLCGAEVLLRWHSEKFGLIFPSEFIPIAEKSELMLPISAWVLQQSFLIIKKLQDKFTIIPNISVNLSGDEVSIGLADRINKLLEQYKFLAQTLTLEITEAQLVNFSDNMISELEQLRLQGFRVSLDSSGAGYSSMSHLSSLGFDEIKIDRSFINKAKNDKKALLLVRAIVSMAQTLGSKVVAEGVETTEQFNCLRSIGVDVVQGHLLGKPMSYEEFTFNISMGIYKISLANPNIDNQLNTKTYY